MNVKELAYLSGRHTNTIYSWIKEEKIKCIKKGKSYEIDRNDPKVQELITGNPKFVENEQAIKTVTHIRIEEIKRLDMNSALCYMQDISNRFSEINDLRDEIDSNHYWELIEGLIKSEEYIELKNKIIDINSHKHLENTIERMYKIPFLKEKFIVY